MVSLIKSTVIMVILVTTLFSCNQNATLQTYFVDNQEQPNFLSIDVPVSVIKIDESKLTEEQKEAYNSVRKLNMLAYKGTGTNQTEYEIEIEKVQAILNDSKYEELMRGGNSTDGKFIIKYLGDENHIDELILFGHANDKGFAVVRVLGDDMNVSEIMKLSSVLDTADMENSQISQFVDFFK